MPKIRPLVLLFFSAMLFPQFSKAQIIPSGNLYAGVGYADSVDVVNRLTFRGWEGSVEALPFRRHTYLGVVLDASGIYRRGVTQYNAVLGFRVSRNYGKWRPFAQVMGGIQNDQSSGASFHPVIEDGGVGVDRKLPFKNFAWRLQFDYVHSHLLSANQNDYRGTTGLVWRF